MRTYQTPGVYHEDWREEPQVGELRTGVPGFLGFVTKPLFSVEVKDEDISKLDARQVPECFRKKTSPLNLSLGPQLEVIKPREQWAIVDGSQRYFAFRRGHTIDMYAQKAGRPELTSGIVEMSRNVLSRLPALRQPNLPDDTPNRYSRWSQFEETLARDPGLADGFTQYAVQGFFANGGRLCYVQMIDYAGDFPTNADVAKGLEAFLAIDDVDLICVPDIMWPVLSSDYRSQEESDSQAVLDKAREMFKERDFTLTFFARIDRQSDKHWKIVDKNNDRERIYNIALEDQQLRIYGDMIQLQREVLKFCEDQGRYFAVLDSLPGADSDKVLEQQRSLRSDNGALYYPWIKALDNGLERAATNPGFIPASGHVAAIYARSDARVGGVHKAPANEALVDVVDLEVEINNETQAQLNPEGVNCLRAFPGRGIRVWGARTLSTDPFWTYINVRRVFLTAARWIEQRMVGYGFESHTPDLWARIERDLTFHFTDLLRQGALAGNSLAEAFFVKCNAETNPAALRDQGQVVTEIGLAPVVPGEFIVVRVIQHASGVRIVGPGQVEA